IVFRINPSRFKIVHDMLGTAELFEAALRSKCIQAVHYGVGVGFKFLIAIAVDKLMQLGDIGCGWVLLAGAAALFPMFDQIEAHLTGPAYAAFHEAKIETRVAPHETPQKNAARASVVRFGEVAAR